MKLALAAQTKDEESAATARDATCNRTFATFFISIAFIIYALFTV